MVLSKTIAKIRKEKNLTVNDLIRDNMSKSSYNRFAAGKADIHSHYFIELLKRLHVTLTELEYIDRGYVPKDINIYLSRIKKFFNKRDANALKGIIKILESEYSKIHNTEYQHLIGLCEILIARLNHYKLDMNQNILYRYLINTSSWTRYEIILFNNSLFYIGPETLSILLSNALKHVHELDDLNPQVVEGFRLLSNAIISLLYQQEPTLALYYISKLEEFQVKEEHVYERILLLFFKGIRKKLEGYSEIEYNKEFNKLYFILDVLQMEEQKRIFKNAIAKL